MLDMRDLFQWKRFVSHTLATVLFWLIVIVSVLLGLAGATSSFAIMAFAPFVGSIFLLSSLLGTLLGVAFARIVAELVLLGFRMSEHINAIRNHQQSMATGAVTSRLQQPRKLS